MPKSRIYMSPPLNNLTCDTHWLEYKTNWNDESRVQSSSLRSSRMNARRCYPHDAVWYNTWTLVEQNLGRRSILPEESVWIETLLELLFIQPRTLLLALFYADDFTSSNLICDLTEILFLTLSSSEILGMRIFAHRSNHRKNLATVRNTDRRHHWLRWAASFKRIHIFENFPSWANTLHWTITRRKPNIHYANVHQSKMF